CAVSGSVRYHMGARRCCSAPARDGPCAPDVQLSSKSTMVPSSGSTEFFKRALDLPKTNSLGSDDDVVGGQLNMGDLVLWRLDEAKLATWRVLSVGAYGVVSLGTYQGLPVAIKQLAGEKSTATVQAFIDEIRLMTTLESQYIVRLLGCAWVRPRDIQLIVEFMDQGDLRQLLAASPAPSWSVKVQLARDMVQGLVYLHSMDIIHRDIKSRNVLLHNEAHTLRAKLTDFGISRIVDVDMTARVGTFRWTAPEVLEGSAYSLAADVYSLGMVLWELETHSGPAWRRRHSLASGAAPPTAPCSAPSTRRPCAATPHRRQRSARLCNRGRSSARCATPASFRTPRRLAASPKQPSRSKPTTRGHASAISQRQPPRWSSRTPRTPPSATQSTMRHACG
uniref:Protein kinase domain-containing protein n=1 Tax=Hucho hucho TaxID=62062 RepID=A0A4W5L7L4_9TELE